ncbi:SMI1/KNR4 family protein [Streptomyces sp. NPDC048564]|uniref:SMI1/KNR4 family protein n=1 Tax=Streptomyces sp. NPDC048564 TaxID=3155760 RepID=UPI00341938DD
MGAMIWSGVRERVEALARADKAREAFGAWDKYGGTGHHFRLADPLSEANVAEAEAQWGVSLPADYRAFLLEVGAGGAGPFYGLTTLSRTDAGWLWSDPGGGTVHERLRFPFPDVEESVRAQAEHERKEPVGCGYFHWLVVSGPQRGQVWLDERPGDGRFSPHGHVGFADWYLDWVEKTEAVVRQGR